MNTSGGKRKVLASAGLLVASLIWGVSFVIVKNATEMVPTIYMLAFRFTIATVLLSIIFWKKLRQLNKKIFFEGLILGSLLFISYVLQTEGIKYTTAGKNAFLTTVYIVIVPFLYWLISKKRPDGYSFGAAFLALIGVGLLSLQGDFGINYGDVLTLLCGISFAGQLVGINRFTQETDPVLLAILQMFFTATFSWIGSIFFGGEISTISFDADLLMAMLYLGVLSSAVAFVLQTTSQKYLSASTAALLIATEAIFGVVSSSILLGEKMTTRMIVGCVVILIAIIIAETKLDFLKRNKKESTVDV